MSVTSAEGFVAAGMAAGVKESGDPDLALVATDDGAAVAAAGVFTSNRMTAAPVTVSRANLHASGGHAAAVILNSGNANAATGEPGIEDAETMCDLTAAELGCDRHHVLVCSTGLIGIPLPIAPIEHAIPALVTRRSADGATDAAEAIRTTDTVRKETLVEADGFRVGGLAKGAAMLAPNMATMLAVLTTDATAEPEVLTRVLQDAATESFNVLTVDGCESTNDTVLLLASGRKAAPSEAALRHAVTAACADLAEQMARDAEGATKVVWITVERAESDEDAMVAARSVAESQLVKCSFYGKDPYWGRVASEVGSAGVRFDPRLVSISYGDVVVASRGVAVAHDEDAVRRHMDGRVIEVTVDLAIGVGEARILTNDLTHAYVDENMGTS